jgi:hypothetical protein
VPRCQRHLFQRENLQHVSPSLQARFVATLLEVYSHILSVRIHQLSVRDAAGSVGTRPTYPNGMKSRCSDRSSMSDLSTNPDHTPVRSVVFLRRSRGGPIKAGDLGGRPAIAFGAAWLAARQPGRKRPACILTMKKTPTTQGDLTDRRRRR